MRPTTLETDSINDTSRIRSEMGDIDAMANSIREFGLIQPIVLAWSDDEVPEMQRPVLIAGGRRLAALKRLNLKTLIHVTHYIWRDEVLGNDIQVNIKLQAIELEENLRRKELTWQEQILGKQRLYELMQKIHGPAQIGRPTRAQTQGFVPQGFGVNKLAAMLGESVGTTSQDLELARTIKALPSLAQADTKGSAMQRVKILGALASMAKDGKIKQAAAPAGVKEKTWELLVGDFRDNSKLINDESVDLILTDLPYGADVPEMHQRNDVATFDDSRVAVLDLLSAVAQESYRALKPNRFACFFFGFNNYTELVASLRNVGFDVNPVPFVWCKPTKSGAAPNYLYSNSYEQVLVARKGQAVFVRPGQSNVVHLPPPVIRLHLVEKPVPLLERLILDMTGEGGMVVDWCAGTGTTGVAAHRTKRFSMLFEKEASMATIAKMRLEAL